MINKKRSICKGTRITRKTLMKTIAALSLVALTMSHQITAALAMPYYGIQAGEYAIATSNGTYYLTARDGGHHTIDPVVTSVTTVGPNEKFKLGFFAPGYFLLQTRLQYWVSASGGGGRGGLPYDDSQTLSTERRDGSVEDTHFYFSPHVTIPQWFNIKASRGFYLTALGGGGKPTRAFHTDAVTPSLWEAFRVMKCGDIGGGYNNGFDLNYDYAIYPKWDGIARVEPLLASNLGGQVKNALLFRMPQYVPSDAYRFNLRRQADGTYAIRTPDKKHYVTAINGGGLANSPKDWDNLVTDRTEVQNWEKFRIVDRGDCTYTIQTMYGWYLGYSPSTGKISTRISGDLNGYRAVGYTPYFQLTPFLN